MQASRRREQGTGGGFGFSLASKVSEHSHSLGRVGSQGAKHPFFYY